MRSYETELVKDYESGCGGVEITWIVPFAWSRPIPATYLDPPEGGAELDGVVYPCEITYYPELGDCFTIDRIQEGSILALMIERNYDAPCDDAMWDAVQDHLEGDVL